MKNVDVQEKHENEFSRVLDTILSKSTSAGDVVILAGHFMLFYDPMADALVPMICEELVDPKLRKIAEKYADNFPSKSFNFGLQLIKLYGDISVSAKVLLLVNDHKFQSGNFQPELKPSYIGRGGELRKSYYATNDQIPNIFVEQIREAGLCAEDIIIRNDDLGRGGRATLPPRTVFYSEQMLRKRFDRNTKKRLLNHPSFSVKNTNNVLKTELVFRDPNLPGIEYCLTDEGDCDCSSEVLQLISELERIAKATTDLIMFIPIECYALVNRGVLAGMHSLPPTATLNRVITIMEYPSGVDGKVGTNFHITEFTRT